MKQVFLVDNNMSFHTKLKCILFLFLLFYSSYIYLTSQSPKEISSSNPPATETKTTPSEVTTEIPKLLRNKLIDKLEAQENILSVIILAVSPRSGSTYLAEILASTPLTSLWQEPLRFLYEKPPVVWFVPKKSANTNMTEVEIPKDKRYRTFVPTAEKLQLISNFMDCKFHNYSELLASQVSRQFIFKLPGKAAFIYL